MNKHIQNKVQLIAYPNRIGNSLSELSEVLKTDLQGAVGGVHILPYFPSNADDGFSPLTHKEVDPNYGSWEDIASIKKQGLDICTDIVLNHLSDESPEFKGFIEKGMKSKEAEMFYVLERDLPNLSKEQMAKIHIRKEKEPFKKVQLADGSEVTVWATFTDHQIDLNYNSQLVWDMMESNIEYLTEKGINLFRLDAFGYITKKPGSSFFLVEPEVFEGLEWFRSKADKYKANILPEVHANYSYQVKMSKSGMFGYGFALPPLILHTFLKKDTTHIQNYLRQVSPNQITVLDTHDGICIPDVRGLLPNSEIQQVVEDVEKRSGKSLYLKSIDVTHTVGAIYQLTTTFFDAMHREEDAYICARAIQMFTPGIPQVYYVGLVGGENNFDLAHKTGDPRSGNREEYTLQEYREELQNSVAQRTIELMKLRNSHPAFNGDFTIVSGEKYELIMKWTLDNEWIQLYVNVAERTFEITKS